MRPSPAADLAALVRLRNLLLAAAGVAIGGVLVLGRVSVPREIWLAMASAFGIGAAGNVANDLYDVDADRVNRPDRPLVAGRVTINGAITLGGILGGAGLVAAAGTLVLFIPASLAPWFVGWYGPRYGITVLLLDGGLALLIWRLMDHHLAHARAALKVAMVIGLAALLWDRL